MPGVIGSSDIFGLNFIVCVRKSQQTELSAMSSIAFDFLLQPFGICFVHALRKSVLVEALSEMLKVSLRRAV